MRAGFGYDVHAFGPGDAVTLGGVRIAFDRGLVALDVIRHRCGGRTLPPAEQLLRRRAEDGPQSVKRTQLALDILMDQWTEPNYFFAPFP